jgi:hypothetical protein
MADVSKVEHLSEQLIIMVLLLKHDGAPAAASRQRAGNFRAYGRWGTN